MLKIALLASLLFSNSARDVPRGRDEGAIFALVIAAEGAQHRRDWPRELPDQTECLRRSLRGDALDRLRASNRYVQARNAEVSATPPPNANVNTISRRRLAPPAIDNLTWYRPEPSADGRFVQPEGDEFRHIIRIGMEMMARPPRRAPPSHVEAAWLSPPYRLCESGDSRGILTLTSPAIQGDVAFVQADFECVICGHGTLYALHRVGSRWQIVAIHSMWVS